MNDEELKIAARGDLARFCYKNKIELEGGPNWLSTANGKIAYRYPDSKQTLKEFKITAHHAGDIRVSTSSEPYSTSHNEFNYDAYVCWKHNQHERGESQTYYYFLEGKHVLTGSTSPKKYGLGVERRRYREELPNEVFEQIRKPLAALEQLLGRTIIERPSQNNIFGWQDAVIF